MQHQQGIAIISINSKLYRDNEVIVIDMELDLVIRIEVILLAMHAAHGHSSASRGSLLC